VIRITEDSGFRIADSVITAPPAPPRDLGLAANDCGSSWSRSRSRSEAVSWCREVDPASNGNPYADSGVLVAVIMGVIVIAETSMRSGAASMTDVSAYSDSRVTWRIVTRLSLVPPGSVRR
jgi:hypothetical protein